MNKNRTGRPQLYNCRTVSIMRSVPVDLIKDIDDFINMAKVKYLKKPNLTPDDLLGTKPIKVRRMRSKPAPITEQATPPEDFQNKNRAEDFQNEKQITEEDFIFPDDLDKITPENPEHL